MGFQRMNDLNRLGVHKRFTRSWEQWELDDMLANYRRLGPRVMAVRLNRSVGSVKGKANEMGLCGKILLVYDEREDTNEL